MDPKSRIVRGVYAFLVVLAAFLPCTECPAADWPQFMRNPTHTGDAADEALQLPLGLVAQVRLDDAVMTSPATRSAISTTHCPSRSSWVLPAAKD